MTQSFTDFETFDAVLDALPAMNGDMMRFLSANVDHLAALPPDDVTRLFNRLQGLNVPSERVGELGAEIRRARQTTSNRPSANGTGPDAGKAEPKTWTTAELLAHEFPDPRWAVQGVLPAGLTFLAGRPKLGKSWLALQLAVSVSTGGKFLGQDATQGKVLYLALEDSERRIQDRLIKQHAPAEADIDFRFEWAHLAGEGTADLMLAQNRNDYALIVIDTFTRALGAGDQMDLSEMNQTVGTLQRLALSKDIALVLVDHHRKGNGIGADVIDDLMGSTSKGAATDTAMGLYRERGKSGATLKITGRDVEDLELALTFDPTLSCWQCEGDAHGVHMETVQADIITALQEHGGKATAAKIAGFLGKKPNNVSRELQELVAKGIVERLPKQGQAVPYRLLVDTIDMNDIVDTNDTNDTND